MSNLFKGFFLTVCVLVLLAGPDCSVGKQEEYGYRIRRDGVYWAGQLMPIADRDTFEWIHVDGRPTAWGRDANYGYYRNMVAPMSHGPSFEPMGDDPHLAKDREHVYWAERHVERQRWFQTSAGVRKQNFGTLAKFVRLIQGADAETFREYGYGWYVDQRHVFKQGQMLKGADASTFRYLDHGLYVDKNHVFRGGKVLEHADPGSIRMDPVTGYLIDDNYVYGPYGRLEAKVDGKVVPASSQGWRALENPRYHTDGHLVFVSFQAVPHADPETFEVLKYGYSKDKSYVYLESRQLSKADPNTFRLLEGRYARDEFNVWYRSRLLTEADAPSFRTLTNGEEIEFPYAVDANTAWYRGNPLGNSHPPSFRALQDGYAKDRDSVWYLGRALDGVDAGTFVGQSEEGRDDHREAEN